MRSVGNANRLAGYGTVPVKDYLRRANEEALVIGQFETEVMDDPIEPMLEGLDVAFIGPMNLSVDFGMPGQFAALPVVLRIDQIEKAVAQHPTRVMGGFAESVEAAKRFIAAGYRFIAVGGDIALLSAAGRSMVYDLHAALNA